MKRAPKSFFISYRGEDLGWATWINEVLKKAGKRVVFQPEFERARSFISQIEAAVRDCERVVVVLSSSYFDSEWTAVEWEAALHRELLQKTPIICTVRVESFDVKGLLSRYPHFDLFGLERNETTAALLVKHVEDAAAILPEGLERKPTASVGLLRKTIPHPRTARLAGREEVLVQMGATLTGAHGQLLLKGMPGVGKTALAVEYCYRHAARYNLILWAEAADLEASLTRQAVAQKPSLAAGSDPMVAVLDWLAGQVSWLLVVDGVDGDTSTETLKSLAELGTGHLLVTSRIAVSGWRASAMSIDPLSDEAAAEYLIGSTKAAGTKQEAVALARRLGGLPIALEQAAAGMLDAKISFAEYASRLDAITHGEGGPTAFSAACELLVAVLDDRARAVLEAFAWLAPEPLSRATVLSSAKLWLSLDPAASAADAPQPRRVAALQEVLISLDRRSLIALDPENLRLHPLLQEFVRERCGERGRERLGQVIELVWEALAAGGAWQPWAAHVPALLAHAARLGIDSDAAVLLGAHLGIHWLHTGQPLSAEPHLKAALDHLSTARGGDHGDTSAAVVLLGRSLLFCGRLQEAEVLFRRVVDAPAAAEMPPAERAAAYSELASSLRQQGRFAEAEPYYRQAYVLALQGPASGLAAADQANNLAAYLREQGRFSEAEPLFREAIQRAAAAASNPRAAHTEASALGNLAILLRLTERYEEAEASLLRALKLWEGMPKGGVPAIAAGWTGLGLVLLERERLPKAEEWLQKARTCHEEHAAEHATARLLSASDLAWFYTKAKDETQARHWFAVTREESAQVLPPEHWLHGHLLGRYGFFLDTVNSAQEARVAYEHALARLSATLGPMHFRTRWVAGRLRALKGGWLRPILACFRRIREWLRSPAARGFR